MDKRIDKIKKMRQFLLEQIAGLTDEQLNQIPEGSNNNIIWNLAHLLATQQGLCYLRTGQTPTVAEKYITPFYTNTKPDRILEGREIVEIKHLLLTTLDELQEGLEKNLFEKYTASPNIFRVYGIEIKSIDDALEFLLYHEGYHTGYILSQRKFVVH